jgi:CBS domain containing-hemolysin-like protein
MNEELLDKIGQLAEQLDNSMFMAQMPQLPDGIHKIGLIGTMREVRDELAQIYKENGGTGELDLQA